MQNGLNRRWRGNHPRHQNQVSSAVWSRNKCPIWGRCRADLEVVSRTTPDFIPVGLKESPDSTVLKTTPDSVVIRVSPDSAIVETSLHPLLDRSMRKGSDVTSQGERSSSGSSGPLQSQNHSRHESSSKDSPQASKYYPDCSYIAPTSCVYPSSVHTSDVQTSGKLTSGMYTSVSPPCFVYHNVPKFLGKIRTNPWIVNLDRHKTVVKTADGNARISNCINPNARLNCTNARLPVTTALHDTTNNCC